MTETASRTLLIVEAGENVEQVVKRVLERNDYALVWEGKDDSVAMLMKREAGGMTLLDAACFTSLPLWVNQIETIRLNTNKVVVDMASRFSRVAEVLGGAINAADQKRGGSGKASDLAVINNSQRELSGLAETLRSLQGGQNAVVDELSGLSGYTSELEDMANQMTSIARHTKMLALNSAVQAARAGSQGAGLAVIANEVHLLSVYTAETSERMGNVAQTLSKAIDSSARLSEELAQKDKFAVEQIDSTVERVLADFNRITDQLTALTHVLQRTSTSVQEEVMEVLVALQFEDRINQILSSVVSNINELHCLIEEKGHNHLNDLGGAEGWLERMSISYTTQEQHRNHHGKDATLQNGTDITFF